MHGDEDAATYRNASNAAFSDIARSNEKPPRRCIVGEVVVAFCE
jgi:hypothetical protein